MKGTLYLYFANRTELFLALFEEHLARFAGPLHSLHLEIGEPVDAVLLDLALRFLRFHRDVGPLLALLFAEPELLEGYRKALLSRAGDAPRVMPPLAAYLRAQQRRGAIGRADPATIGEALLGACFTRAFHDAFFDESPDEKADRTFLRRLIRILIA